MTDKPHANEDPAQLVPPEPDQRPDIWPWGTHRDDDGVLVIGGVRALDLPTPSFVWSRSDFRGRAQVWRAAIDEAFWPGYGMAGGQVHYAAKAFCAGAAVRDAVGAGLGIDTASLGELTCALRAGAPPASIGLHGNNKSQDEIELAIRSGIGRIIADSLYEVELIGAIAARLEATGVPVMVRVNSGVHAGGHEFIATAHEDQKFGLAPTGDALVAARLLDSHPRLCFAGLHSHIGSQIFASEGFASAAERMMQVAAQLKAAGIATDHVILGGGYGIAYSRRDPVAPSAKEFADSLAQAVRGQARRQGLAVPLIGIEPGRSIAGPSMVTLYRVGTIKHQPLGDGSTRAYVSVTGGMSDNIRPALYGAHYTALLASRPPRGPLMAARVVGKHCESGDIVVHDVSLPRDLRAGDILAVPATGAYGHSMASNYNMVPRPGVVAVEDGRVTPVIAAETVDDVLARDLSLNGDGGTQADDRG